MKRNARSLWLVLGLLSACSSGGGAASPPASVPDAFPPMADDHPPGASARAVATAKALGRGVNFGNMLDAPREGDWGLSVKTEFFTKARQAGFSTIRLPVRWSNHAEAEAPYLIGPAFMSRVEAIVDEALASGFYLILDMHHYRQLDGDPVDGGEFEVAADVVDVRFLTLWRQIAERFRNKSDHLLFEIYNEPHGRLTDARWNDLSARALNAIRQTNSDRIVIVGPTGWNTPEALARLRLPNDANLIATIHHYEPFNFTHQGASWVSPMLPTGVGCCGSAQRSTIIQRLDLAKSWSDAQRYPIFLGEFGAYRAAPLDSRIAFARFVRDAAEARGMSWAYWEMAASFGIYDPFAHDWHAKGQLRDALMGK